MKVEAASVRFKVGESQQELFRVAGSASVDGKKLTVTLVHSHASEPVDVTIELAGGRADGVRQTVLTHKELNAHNTFDKPEVVVPKSSSVAQKGAQLVCTLPAASVTRLDIQLG
jgi:alpha-L-arabinofuranosidase